MALLPAGQIDIPHRHSTAAINYYFEGRGHSIVGGQEDFWGAGDLHLSAPGWAVHHHMSYERTYVFNVQDQALVQSMEALLWQEDIPHDGPIRLLGMESGFETNRSKLERIG
jgi:gentisate 1,2-dioxygenase